MRAVAAVLPLGLPSGACAQDAPLLQVAPILAALGEAGLIAGPDGISRSEAFELYGPEFSTTGHKPGAAERILSVLTSGSCDGPPIS